MALIIRLLGSPVIEMNGEPIRVDTRKAIALFAYLAVTHTGHSRDHLATLLWPEYDQSRARAALRRTLSPLNKALGGQWMHIDREMVSLDIGSGYWLDLDEFRSLLAEVAGHTHAGGAPCPACLERLAQAVDLYQGNFLEGFTLRDSPSFDDWQYFETETLRKELSDALEKLVQGLSAVQDFQAAIQYARQWSALDPLQESAHRQLMLLYAWSGARADAVRQYRECVRILDHELGVPPLEETTLLYQQIMEDQPPAPPAGSHTEYPSPAPEALPSSSQLEHGWNFPLVGREAAWAWLNAGYQKIQADGRFLVIEGEAGIGKTRLAVDFLNSLRAKGCITLALRCYEGETHLAYSSFLEGLRAAIQGPGSLERLQRVQPMSLREAARLLPELTLQFPGLPDAPPLEGPGGQSRFLEGLRQVLEGLCSGPTPGVLFIDDVHWADEASLDLLTYLVRRLGEFPVLLLVTWRSEGIPRGHRLRALVAEAARSEAGGQISLDRLARSQVLELIEALPYRFPGPDLADRLFTETEGLPHFVIEYLEALRGREADSLDFDWSPPGGVRDLLRSRLSGVGEAGRQLLTTGAAIGRSFSYDTLLSASGRSDEETVAGLEDLVARALFVEVGGADRGDPPAYDFSHEQLRQLVYDETSFARRRLLHRRIANTLLNRSRDPKEIERAAGQIAHHYRMAGQETEAAKYYRLAGEHAQALFANTEAIAHYRTALALGYPQPAALHESIGDLQTLMGTYQAALVSYGTAAALNGEETLPRLDHKLGIVHHRLGEWERAESHFQEALSGVSGQGSPETRAQIYADWSLAAYRQGDRDRAANLAQEAMSAANDAGAARGQAQVNNILGILARSQGRLDAAQAYFMESLGYAETLDDPGVQIAALNNLALVHAEREEIAQARKNLDAALELCVMLGDRHREAALLNNLADLLHTSGEIEAAMHQLKQAVAIFAEIGGEGGDLQPEIWNLVEW